MAAFGANSGTGSRKIPVLTLLGDLSWTWRVLLFLALVVGAMLRLYDLGLESLSHPEVYVPGIPLVPGISEPPPRMTLAETLTWHFHDEPHPIGWYVMMYVWTAFAGTTEWAMRLPSVLFGTAGILLAFAVGRRGYGVWVGVIAAVLMALHGFHVHWSQQARMYVPGATLGLLSTYLLLRLASARHRQPWLELCYGLSLFATTQTVELFWPIFMLQIVWAIIFRQSIDSATSLALSNWRDVPRIIQVQALALMASLPEIAHAIYRARQDAAEPPSLGFFADMLSFGFLYGPDKDALPPLVLAPNWRGALLLAAVLLTLAAWRARPDPGSKVLAAGKEAPLPAWLIVTMTVLSTAVILWFAAIAQRRNAAIVAVAAMPLLIVFAAPIVMFLRNRLALAVPRFDSALRRLSPTTTLLFLSGILAPVALFAASFVTTVLAARAFVVFTPYAVLLAAAGVVTVFRAPVLKMLAVGALVVVFALSVPFERKSQISPRDYKGIAAQLKVAMQPGDIVLIRPKQWADTPLFYYLPDARYVTVDIPAALARAPASRVWLVTWPNPGTTAKLDDRRKALGTYQRVATLTAMRASAELFVRKPGE